MARPMSIASSISQRALWISSSERPASGSSSPSISASRASSICRWTGQLRGRVTLIDALKHTALTVVELNGVNDVLRDDPSDNVANYAKKEPLKPQLISALDRFVNQ